MRRIGLGAAALSCAALLSACGGGGLGGFSGMTSVSVSVLASGIPAGTQVIVQGGSQTMAISANGTTAFPQPLSDFDTISVVTPPAGGSICQFLNGDTAGGSIAVAAISGTTVDLECSVYPAFNPTLPQLGPSNGGSPNVFSSPVVTPVFFNNVSASSQSQETSFLSNLVQSGLWPVLSQYGVGTPTVRSPVVLTTGAPSSFTTADAANLVTADAATWDGGTLLPQSFFMIYVPNGTNIGVSNAGAYHSATTINGTLVGYAVIPVSGTNDESAPQHELMEGVADPDGTSGYSTFPGAIAWAAQIGQFGSPSPGTEIGDMCENYATTYLGAFGDPLNGYVVQPIWSNTVAAIPANPCVWNTTSTAQIAGAIPTLPSTLTDSNGANPVQGVIVAAGSSVTIPVKVFSQNVSSGVLSLSADLTGYFGTGTATLTGWGFSFDRQYALNGDTVNLTITAPASYAAGLYTFSVTAVSALGSFSWPGGISSSTTY